MYESQVMSMFTLEYLYSEIKLKTNQSLKSLKDRQKLLKGKIGICLFTSKYGVYIVYIYLCLMFNSM